MNSIIRQPLRSSTNPLPDVKFLKLASRLYIRNTAKIPIRKQSIQKFPPILNPTAEARETQLCYPFTIRIPLVVNWIIRNGNGSKLPKSVLKFHTPLTCLQRRQRFPKQDLIPINTYQQGVCSQLIRMNWDQIAQFLMKIANRFIIQANFLSESKYHQSIDLENLQKLNSQHLMVSEKFKSSIGNTFQQNLPMSKSLTSLQFGRKLKDREGFGEYKECF